MLGILPDINVEGHLKRIEQIWLSSDWQELWNGLGLTVESFDSLGLLRDSLDQTIWRRCQEQNLVLITANRNEDAPDSLTAVIRDENRATSLPVITLATPDRVLHDNQYAEAVAERLLDYLFRIDELRVTGRMFVP
jgi:hypothetical protein